MDLAQILRDLWRRRVWLILAAFIGLIAAASTQYNLSLSPPSAKSKSIEFGAARAQLLIDSEKSPVVNFAREFDPLVERATIYASLMSSSEVQNDIAKAYGDPRAPINVTSPISSNQTRAAKEPTANERGAEIVGDRVPLSAAPVAEPGQPVITITTQAPTGAEAVKLAQASISGLRSYIGGIQSGQTVPASQRVKITQLGPATGGTANQGADRNAAILAFVAIFLGSCLVILFISGIRRANQEPMQASLGAVRPYPQPPALRAGSPSDDDPWGDQPRGAGGNRDVA